jgi:histidinol-phosphate/aromatic aminotransferase/cobyric acid decarboxylase-like protein
LIGRRDLGNIIVVRSLTKIWSLAAIRAGYVVGPATVIEKLEAQRQPWSVNALACAALEYCAGDSETPARIAEEVATLRVTLRDALSELPFVEQIWCSSANFLLLRVKEGPVIVSELAARGIAVRPAETFPGLGTDHIRVAVRPAHDCQRLLAALWEIAG